VAAELREGSPVTHSLLRVRVGDAGDHVLSAAPDAACDPSRIEPAAAGPDPVHAIVVRRLGVPVPGWPRRLLDDDQCAADHPTAVHAAKDTARPGRPAWRPRRRQVGGEAASPEGREAPPSAGGKRKAVGPGPRAARGNRGTAETGEHRRTGCRRSKKAPEAL